MYLAGSVETKAMLDKVTMQLSAAAKAKNQTLVHELGYQVNDLREQLKKDMTAERATVSLAKIQDSDAVPVTAPTIFGLSRRTVLLTGSGLALVLGWLLLRRR